MARKISPTAASSAGTTFTFHEVVGMLRRRMWLIIILTVLMTVIFGVVCFFWQRTNPKYTSTGLIRCNMPGQENILLGISPIMRSDIISLQTQNQAMFLGSEYFLSQVLRNRDKIKSTDWYKQRQDDPGKPIRDLGKSFTASPGRNTQFVQVYMQANSKVEAKVILDEILEQFRQTMKDNAEGDARAKLQTLNNEKNKLDREILSKKGNLATLREQANVPGGLERSGGGMVMEELRAIMLEKLTLEAQIKKTMLDLQTLQKEVQDNGVSGAVTAAINNDPTVLRYQAQLMAFQTHLDGLMDRLGPEHQEVQKIRTLMDSISEQIRQRELQLQQQYSNVEQTMLEKEIASLQAEYERVAAQHEALLSRQSDVDKKRAEYIQLQAEIEDMQQRVERFDDQINGYQMRLDNPKLEADVESRGTEPRFISFPRYEMFIPGGIFLGIMLSLGLVFLLEFLDDSIKTPSDIVKHLHVPMLGMVPEYNELDRDDVEIAKITYIHPQAMISESFRQIRTNLYYSAPAENMRTLLVTSCSAGCGKTSTVVNLAITLAMEGKRVLVVDANFRKSAINRLFSQEGAPRGLSNILSGQSPAAEAIRKTEIEGLDVMDAGPEPPNPSVLLNSKRMKTFMESQKSYYDHVIIDGPPSLVVADARILADWTDGTIIVVHAGDTSRGIVQRLIRELRTDKVQVLGVVLNSVRPQKGGYFRKSYETYYDYVGHRETASATLPAGNAGKDVGNEKTS
ncbi:MAG: polysaccharide biosynthesis tyrosine autokinase [Sedimentisphaerales bacterium]|nr:polysaccharide biosynthesis tyrosine autokinase [Sedimentisphaerales bacterium]